MNAAQSLTAALRCWMRGACRVVHGEPCRDQEASDLRKYAGAAEVERRTDWRLTVRWRRSIAWRLKCRQPHGDLLQLQPQIVAAAVRVALLPCSRA